MKYPKYQKECIYSTKKIYNSSYYASQNSQFKLKCKRNANMVREKKRIANWLDFGM